MLSLLSVVCNIVPKSPSLGCRLYPLTNKQFHAHMRDRDRKRPPSQVGGRRDSCCTCCRGDPPHSDDACGRAPLPLWRTDACRARRVRRDADASWRWTTPPCLLRDRWRYPRRYQCHRRSYPLRSLLSATCGTALGWRHCNFVILFVNVLREGGGDGDGRGDNKQNSSIFFTCECPSDFKSTLACPMDAHHESWNLSIVEKPTICKVDMLCRAYRSQLNAYSRYFQHAHFIPIVSVEKRGSAY